MHHLIHRYMRLAGLFAVAFLMILTGCLNSDDPETIDTGIAVELRPLGDLNYGADMYACTRECYIKLVSQIDTGYVINNDAAYNKFKIRAACLEIQQWPDVDFTKNTLIAGVIITPTSCCTTLRIDFTKDLSLPRYTLMVTLQPGINTYPGAVFFWGVTSKLPADSEVLFMHKYYSIQ